MKFTTKKLCFMAMLTAITVILAVFCTFRVGNQIKIPLKFITIFIAGVLYGPAAAGAIGAIADILNTALVPVGPWIPQITAVEFVCGAIYGLCFYKAKNNSAYFLRCIVCAVANFVIGISAMSLVLVQAGIFPSIKSAVIVRLPAAFILLGANLIVTVVARKYIFILKGYINDELF